jgi:hypothetical protein
MKKVTIIAAVLMLTIVMAACGSVSVSTTETPVGTGTAVTAEAPSGTQAGSTGDAISTANVDALITMVNDFVTSGDITGQAEMGLLAKLETIKEKALNGQSGPAANEIGAFVNEVQAQLGKKISDTAATALIAKAQEVAADMMAPIPVTGGENMSRATSQPTGVVMGHMAKPTPMGTPLENKPQWDVVAQQIAQSVGLGMFDYEVYQLPAGTAWEDTLAYYETEATTAGWGSAPSPTQSLANGHYVIWSVTSSDGTTNIFIVAQLDTPDGSYTLNLFGNK